MRGDRKSSGDDLWLCFDFFLAFIWRELYRHERPSCFEGVCVMAVNGCPVCLQKQRRIDELEEQVKSLQKKLRYQVRKEQEGLFGSSTPSSKRPVKPNSEPKERKPKGARPGHKGSGRRSHDNGSADRYCGCGCRERAVSGVRRSFGEEGVGGAQRDRHSPAEGGKDHVSCGQTVLSSLPSQCHSSASRSVAEEPLR